MKTGPSAMGEFTPEQLELQEKLVKTIRDAIPVEQQLEGLRERSHSCYRAIAEVLVALRHAFPGGDGEPFDLRGRSHGYRVAVREAYARAGADVGGPIPKRLTAGVAYWVRKLLTDRYGERRLCELGVLRGPVGVAYDSYARLLDDLPDDPTVCLSTIVGILNTLAVDPDVVPTEEVVRSAVRAVLLLRDRLGRGLEVAWSAPEPEQPVAFRAHA
jgi:hypothetical protein